jgi:hypothetical protein
MAKKNCENCQKSGVCPLCEGTGIKSKGNLDSVKCGACGGTKKCIVCNGTGREEVLFDN